MIAGVWQGVGIGHVSRAFHQHNDQASNADHHHERPVKNNQADNKKYQQLEVVGVHVETQVGNTQETQWQQRAQQGNEMNFA